MTKENYRNVKNVISHPDFDMVSYLRDYDKFAKANANKELILDLKCYLKDFVDKIIANEPIKKNITDPQFNDIENDPLKFAKELMTKLSFFPVKSELMALKENVSYRLQKINLDIYKRINFVMDDVALVELEQPFEFGKSILASCLLENDKKKFDNSFIRKSI